MSKSNLTKKALISSVIALVLCATMLLGTTFAWFTDTVESSGNIIKSGDLEVKMYWADQLAGEQTEWVDVEETDSAIFDYDLWEPGYSQVRYVKIANTGNLALKYMLNIVPTGDTSALAEVIDVYFAKVDANFTAPTTFADVTADDGGLVKVGTLADLIADPDGAAYGVLLPEEGAESYNEEEALELEAETGSVTVCLVLHMQESAGNEYENMSIGSEFTLSLIATQFTYENDSFNNDYDANASYPTVTFTEGTHVLNETLVAIGDKTDAVAVSGTDTQVNITGGYYQGSWALYANEGATVDINGGTFKSTGSCAVLANNGAAVNIYGGFFEAAELYTDTSFVLNLQDNTNSNINVYGGTFVNFNPAAANTEPGGLTSFVVNGYTVVEEPQDNGDIWYIVHPEEEAETVEELQAALTSGTPVTLTDDIELNNELLTVPANTDVTIDLNGNDIVGVATNASASNLIKVNSGASLTLTGNGTVSSRATNPDTNWGDGKPNQYPGYASNTISNSGTLIINGATIINYTGRGGASYCIDNYPGANLIINSGTIYQAGGDIAIRMFANSATTETNVTINGGTITGYRAVWIQLPSNNANVAPKVNLTVTGGTLTSSDTTNWNQAIYSYSYGNSFAATIVNITGGVFNGDLAFSGGTKIGKETVNITGGTFNGDVFYYTADGTEDIPY